MDKSKETSNLLSILPICWSVYWEKCSNFSTPEIPFVMLLFCSKSHFLSFSGLQAARIAPYIHTNSHINTYIVTSIGISVNISTCAHAPRSVSTITVTSNVSHDYGNADSNISLLWTRHVITTEIINSYCVPCILGTFWSYLLPVQGPYHRLLKQ